jgi:c-di-GMP-binding flagellar brake protein YcgR
MSRGYGGNIMLEQYSMGKFVTYMKSLLMFFLPKKSGQFRVTPKGEGSLVPYKLIIPQITVFLAGITAIGWALVQLFLQMRNDNFIVAVNCLWALYNSGLGLAIIQYDYKKLFQRREDFRIPDALPVFYSFTSRNKDIHRIAVADNLTRKGLSLLAIGHVAAGQELRIEIMLPKETLVVNGSIVQEKCVTVENYPICRIGVLFADMPQNIQDTMSRYLHESAITKFMKEYSTRYKTYLERRFMTRRHFHERAYRALTYLPVIVHAENENPFYGVIRDISETGLLLATQVFLSSGSRLTAEVVLGKDTILLNGTVVRDMIHEVSDFPEFLAGMRFTEVSSNKVTHILKITDKIGSLVLE